MVIKKLMRVMIPTPLSHRCEVADELTDVWDRAGEVIAVLVEE